MARLIDRTRMERLAGGVGAAASLVCGLHCMALPLFSALMLFAGVSLHTQASLELTLMAGSFLLAAAAFLPAALEGRNPFALQAAALALLFFLAGWQASWLGMLVRQSLTVSASLMLLLAHAQNLWRLRHHGMRTLRHCAGQP